MDMEKEKILITTTTFPRWRDDTIPMFVYDLSDKLSSKFDIVVLAPHHKNAKKRENMNNMDVRRFSYFKPERLQKLCYDGGIIPNMKTSFLAKIQMPLLIISEFFSAYLIIKNENIKMIHAHWMLPQGFVGVFLKKIFRIPLIVSVHGSDLFPLKNMVLVGMQDFVIKNSDYVTVNSHAAKNEIVKRFPHHRTKIRVIPMGIDAKMFSKKNPKKPYKYSNNKLLLFVGRLSDQKGLQYLIDAMADILKHDSNAKLLVIGEGPYKEDLIERAINRGVKNNIEFLGAIQHSNLPFFYNIADIFIMPSLSNDTGTESLGLTLIEAMASRCPVIGTDVGGIPNLIKNGRNGILVAQKEPKQLASVIIALLKSPIKRKKIGDNAALSVRNKYSWGKISEHFIGLYNKILK